MTSLRRRYGHTAGALRASLPMPADTWRDSKHEARSSEPAQRAGYREDSPNI